MTKKNLPADLALPAFQFARLARAFDFEGLSQLASTLVETNPPSREKA